jgi:DNA-binding transcriptional ArsR family regulator
MTTTGEPPIARREILELVARGLLTQAVVVAARLGIADLVAGGPRSAAELAEETGTRPDALARLLRALVALGVLTREDDGRVSATPLSRALEDGPGSIRALAALVGEVTWRAWGALGHSVATGEPAFRHEYGEGLFEYLGREPEAARAFQAWMTEQSRLHSEALVGAIDLTGVERLVDVGGGRGTLLATLLEASPGLRGVLYDRPEVASTAEALAAAGIADRAEAVGGDFFESVPEGADRYVLKLVIHDWDDERAIRILDSVRRAIPPHGLLLLVEHLLPEGDGYDHAVWLDLNMLVMTDGGRERTVAEYRDLLARAGFRLTRVLATSGPMSVIEAAPGP